LRCQAGVMTVVSVARMGKVGHRAPPRVVSVLTFTAWRGNTGYRHTGTSTSGAGARCAGRLIPSEPGRSVPTGRESRRRYITGMAMETTGAGARCVGPIARWPTGRTTVPAKPARRARQVTPLRTVEGAAPVPRWRVAPRWANRSRKPGRRGYRRWFDSLTLLLPGPPTPTAAVLGGPATRFRQTDSGGGAQPPPSAFPTSDASGSPHWLRPPQGRPAARARAEVWQGRRTWPARIGHRGARRAVAC
jgi:hypothetical protein